MWLLDFLTGRKGRSSGERSSKSPEFVRKERQGANTYEVYRANDLETAKAYLLAREVRKPLYYVVVETPEGTWGRDVNGLYLERLLPWQANLEAVESTGEITALRDTTCLENAARGISDNFLVWIQCGRCGHKWLDGVRYQDLTAVRCPKCHVLNKVDSGAFEVNFV